MLNNIHKLRLIGGKNMAMKLSKNNLCINQIVGQKNEKITVEGDEIVPDVKPDVLSIVSANGNICMYKKEIQDGKIKLDGSINSYVIYIADDENSSMRALNTSIDFSRTIDMKEIKSNMQLECRSELTNIECKILNGRKVSLKANVQLAVTAYSNENVEYIDSIEDRSDMQLLNEKVNINSLIGNGSTKVYAKDTVAIDNVDNLSEIIKVGISLENKENKISYNKVLTKADAVFKIMYLTDDGRINTVNATIPVMGFIDMQDVNEENLCDVSYELKNILVKPNNVEEHSMHVEAEIEVFCFVYKQHEINMIQDLYSKTAEIKYTKKTMKVIIDKNEINETFNMRKQEKIEEIRQNKIYDVEVRTTIINNQVEDGRVNYQGELNLTFIYEEEHSSRINVKNVIEPFEFAVTSSNITNKSKIETNINLVKKDFVVMSDNTIDIKIDLNFKLNVIKEGEISLIESINETEVKNRESFSIVIYYTKVGDTLWKIAKRFGSTVDEIVKVNSIENPDVIIPGEQLFIPR